MKEQLSTPVSQKTRDMLQLARRRVAKAEAVVEVAKEESRAAKRKRQEAKEAARQAKKQLRHAKDDLVEACLALTEAEEKAVRQARHAVSQGKRLVPISASKTKQPGHDTGDKRRNGEPTVGVTFPSNNPLASQGSTTPPETPGTSGEAGAEEMRGFSNPW